MWEWVAERKSKWNESINSKIQAANVENEFRVGEENDRVIEVLSYALDAETGEFK